MAITKVINVDVNTGDSVQELDKLEKGFKDVDQAADKTSKSVDDVAGNGGAIAILDQLTGGLATRFKDAYEASKLFSVSLKGVRSALIATGIGALVVALGLVVAYWDDIVDYITDANGKLEEQQTLIESTATLLDAELATINKKLELNKLEGKANEELEKQRVAILKRIQEQSVALREKLEEQLLNLKATKTEVGFWDTIKANILFATLGTKALAGEAASLAAQRLNEIKDLETAIEAQKLKEIDLAIQLYNAENTGTTDGSGVTRGQATGLGDDILTPEDRKAYDSAKALSDAKVEFAQEDIDKIGNLRAKALADELTRAEAVEYTKQALTRNTFAILNELGEEGAQASKYLSAGLATVETYKATIAAYAAGSAVGGPAGVVLGPLSAAAAAAAGILQVKNILKTPPKVKSAGGASSGVGSAPQAPSFNLVEGTEGNQIATSLETQNQPIQAVVVSGAVTTAQSADRNIIEDSSL